MNHLDLFSGIGGFSLAIQRVGIEHGWHGYSEIDTYANDIFRRHFSEAEKLGRIESIQPGDLPRLDLVTFGFPCQDLSIAGKRGGLTASRSGLFFEAMRIIRAKRPRYIIFENVKGLFSSNGGYDFIVCLQEIANAGYDGGWQLLNTRWFLPQNRERVFFVGHLRGGRRPEIFPIEGGVEESRRELGREVSPCINARDYKGVSNQEMALVQVGSVANGDAGRVFDPEGISCTLKAEGGGWGAKTGLYQVHNLQQRSPDRPSKLEGQAGGSGPLSKDDGTTYCLESKNLQAVERYPLKFLERNQKNIDGDYAYTIDGANTGGISVDSNIRRLTPTEAERLQGFPDGWTDKQSDTQRYKQLGNAVSVPVVQTIMERLKDVL